MSRIAGITTPIEQMARYTVLSITLILLVFPLSKTEAARGIIYGFEGSYANECSTNGGTITNSNTIFNSGTTSLRINPVGGAVGNCGYRGYSSGGLAATNGFSFATAYHKFMFRVATLPTSTTGEEILNIRATDNTIKATARINSNGTLTLYNNSTVAVATSATQLSTNTWYRLEWKIGTGASSAYKLKINGTSEFSGTGSFGSTNNGGGQLGKVTNRGTSTVDYYYDDLSVDDTDYPGDTHIMALRPNATGTLNQWTNGVGNSNWSSIDEAYNNNADYVRSNTSLGPNTISQHNLFDTANVGISGTINSVRVLGTESENISGTTNAQIGVWSNGVIASTTGTNLTTSNSYLGKILNTDPNTGSAWTAGALDLLQAGQIDNGSSTVAIRAAWLMVDVEYTSSTSDIIPPAAISNLSASDPTTSSIFISWTSPGDDDSSGTATTYDLRYSTALITDGNFTSATEVSGEPAPQIAGTPQSMTVSGLSASTTYYFAMKTSDEVPNTSAISNSASSTTASPASLTPVAYWKFDEVSGTSASDSSDSHTGALLGSPTPSWTAGRVNNAVSVTSTGYIRVVQTVDFQLSNKPFTVSAWVLDDSQAPQLASYHRIFSWYDSLKNIQLGLGYDSSNNRRFYIINSNSATTPQQVTSGAGVTTGWHYLAATFDGTSTYNIYLDGNLANGGNLAVGVGLYTASAANVYIGQRGDNAGYVKGLIDEARIYDRALSQEEIQADMNAGAPVYQSSGMYTSGVLDATAGVSAWGTLLWSQGGTGTITVKARSSDSATMSGAPAWGSCNAIVNEASLSSGGCVTNGDRYIQYQAALATADTSMTPSLDNITLGYVLNSVSSRIITHINKSFASSSNIDYSTTAGSIEILGAPPKSDLTSSVFDTQIASGTALNYIVWQGDLPTSAIVRFQIATSNCSNGATDPPVCSAGSWNYIGPDGSNATYYGPANPDIALPINLKYQNNYRYFRYFMDLQSGLSNSPRVDDIIVGWSP